MRRISFLVSIVGLVVVAMTPRVTAQISYTGGTYTQDFNGMGTAGTTSPTGWSVDSITNAAATGTATDPPVTTGSWALSASTLTGASNGGTITGGNYNIGTTGDADRALGSLASGGNQKDTYLAITNNTGFTITQFSIFYDGEQWRLGQAAAATNVLTLQYSIDGTTWTNMGAAFNFTSPITTGTAGALDGNAAANRVAGIGGAFTPTLAILPNAVFYIRWADPDDGGSDAMLGVDNFSFFAVPEPSTWAMMIAGAGLLGATQRLFRKRN